jgi:HAD superfamily hydrolase (TIGR01450 family)
MRPVPRYLLGSAQPLCQAYDVALLDLDGVIYLGRDAIPGMRDALTGARSAGMRLAFVTNNAARTPQQVAAHLTELGVAAKPDEVVTSAQAAARYLADRLPPGARVLVVGTTGLEQALAERGLTPVFDASDSVDAVVQGYSPELSWRQLAEGAVAINREVPWVATNLDPTVPSPRGPLPGNGSMVAALRHATGRRPVATGKPDPAMHRESLLRSAAERPLVVGDRLDTDIEGANAVGCPSLLVLSGVTAALDLLAAPPQLRPSYLAADVRGLLTGHAEPRVEAGAASCGRWRVSTPDNGDDAPAQLRLAAGTAEAATADDPDADDLDALRALCAAAWEHHDQADAAPAAVPAVPTVPAVTADDGHARQAIARLGLLG